MGFCHGPRGGAQARRRMRPSPQASWLGGVRQHSRKIRRASSCWPGPGEVGEVRVSHRAKFPARGPPRPRPAEQLGVFPRWLLKVDYSRPEYFRTRDGGGGSFPAETSAMRATSANGPTAEIPGPVAQGPMAATGPRIQRRVQCQEMVGERCVEVHHRRGLCDPQFGARCSCSGKWRA